MHQTNVTRLFSVNVILLKNTEIHSKTSIKSLNKNLCSNKTFTTTVYTQGPPQTCFTVIGLDGTKVILNVIAVFKCISVILSTAVFGASVFLGACTHLAY